MIFRVEVFRTQCRVTLIRMQVELELFQMQVLDLGLVFEIQVRFFLFLIQVLVFEIQVYFISDLSLFQIQEFDCTL